MLGSMAETGDVNSFTLQALAFTQRALPQAEALRAVAEHPGWLRELVDHPASWVPKSAIYL